ncbi:MAG TPA: CoA transferase [Pseudonocardia sp.]|jgi:CoA:oxalate CoA-transferase|nr:CoA transferase [Pseudonocardia sp.]
MTESQTSKPPFPLAGVRVLDLCRALSGPYTGRLLSDLGAEVVKVEVADADITQKFGPPSHGHTGLYVQLNTGKQNISLDLGKEAGAEILLDLVEHADIVLENFRPGTLDRFGVGWEALSKRNPKLVLLSISGFGQWGPEKNRQAYAPVLHAESGLLGRQAEADGAKPNDIMLSLADSVAGMHGMIGVLAALRVAEQTGVGQHIDLAMFDAMLATDEYVHYSLEKTYPGWPARGTIYELGDGPILLSGDKRFIWHRLSRAYGLTDPDPSADTATRIANRADVIKNWVEGFATRAEAIPALESAGVAWAEIRTPATVMESPTAIARQVATEVDDREGGTRPVIRMPYRFSAASCEPRGGAAYIGEHNAEVLGRWLGRTPEQVAELEEAGGLIPCDRATVSEGRQ